ncbi:MAG: TIR domain-containing protein [Gammaproteobacteria bacterium]|nr:TIR domain-containing protein [Gammaproteobacteria bacterium]
MVYISTFVIVFWFFVSYAHMDERLVWDLMERLRVLFEIASEYEFVEWNDRQIVVGNDWDVEIKEAMEAVDFGLLMVSPGFLGRPYILEQELTHFLDQGEDGVKILKPVVPVGLKKVLLDGSVDSKGLGNLQIFRNGDGRWFSELRGNNRDLFVDALFQAILVKLRRMGSEE